MTAITERRTAERRHVSPSVSEFAFLDRARLADANADLGAEVERLRVALREIHDLRPLGKKASEYSLSVERIARAALAKGRQE